MENKYDQYATLDAQIKSLTEYKEKLREEIVNDMTKAQAEKIDMAYGSFSIAKLKKWTYTDKVADLENKYKAQKAKEESTGEATYEEKPSLRYTQLKI